MEVVSLTQVWSNYLISRNCIINREVLERISIATGALNRISSAKGILKLNGKGFDTKGV